MFLLMNGKDKGWMGGRDYTPGIAGKPITAGWYPEKMRATRKPLHENCTRRIKERINFVDTENIRITFYKNRLRIN